MTERNRETTVVTFLPQSKTPVLGGPGREIHHWPKMGTKYFCYDAGRMKAGNQNLARQMCMRML